MSDKTKVKAIIKKCGDKYGEMTEISTDLKDLQEIVGGYLEELNCGRFLILCNEDGKYLKLDYNMPFGRDILVGNIIVVGAKNGELADVEISFEEWKEYVDSQKVGFLQ